MTETETSHRTIYEPLSIDHTQPQQDEDEAEECIPISSSLFIILLSSLQNLRTTITNYIFSCSCRHYYYDRCHHHHRHRHHHVWKKIVLWFLLLTTILCFGTFILLLMDQQLLLPFSHKQDVDTTSTICLVVPNFTVAHISPEQLHLDRSAMAFTRKVAITEEEEEVDDDDDESKNNDTEDDYYHWVSNGFYWDEEDAKTNQWRPQGVTTYNILRSNTESSSSSSSSSSSRLPPRYALVSWYGRAEEGYANYGGRISFVDISQMRMITGGEDEEKQNDFNDNNNNLTEKNALSYPYTHVLLVDENFCTFPNIHVGGIEQVNGTLYVTDSREGEGNAILKFDIQHDLYQVVVPTPSPQPLEEKHNTTTTTSISKTATTTYLFTEDKEDGVVDEIIMLGHRYILRQSSSFPSPTKPSFLSYDSDHDKFVIGTYFRCGGKVGRHADWKKSCFDRTENRIDWIDEKYAMDIISEATNTNNNFVDGCLKWHFFSEMQGVASAVMENVTYVWISSSYGSISASHLHAVRIPLEANLECFSLHDIMNAESATIYHFPPGLEDLHIEASELDRYMWMLTEFEKRIVFATKLSLLI